MSELTARTALPADVAAVARIYNEGIEDGLATFETQPRSPADIEKWMQAGFPLVVVEDGGGEVVAWASAPPYRAHRPAYSGVGTSPCTSRATRAGRVPGARRWRPWFANASRAVTGS